MNDGNEKKGLFGRLTGNKKAKKSPCCCGFEIEELPEETAENKNEEVSTEGKGGSCCK